MTILVYDRLNLPVAPPGVVTMGQALAITVNDGEDKPDLGDWP
jgi:hypothetical protein